MQVAARRVTYMTGLLFIVCGFIPKTIAVVLYIPDAIVGGVFISCFGKN